MNFISTRGTERVTGAQAIVQGIAKDGGLFVPETFPAVSAEELNSMLEMDYSERAALILHKYFEEFNKEELTQALAKAYASFDGEDPAPLVRVENGMYMLELFHGPTCAYKDLSINVFPYLLKESCGICGVKEEILLLVATSGDAGKAALEVFQDAEGVKVIVFYPEDGISKMQKLQICTQEGENLNVVAVRGNFDDCQTAVKRILQSQEYANQLKEKNILLSTANSMNFGRIAPQIAYFFSAYLDLVSSEQIQVGDEVDFAIPTGNCGNIIAAYYAKRMGLPIGKLICASNKNKVIADFVAKGVYDSRRQFFRTMSSSIDILVASNLERLIYEVSGRNTELTAERMQSLAKTGKYELRVEEMNRIRELIFAGFTSEDDTVDCMYEFFSEYGYPMDTHTGVAMNVAMKYEKYKEDNHIEDGHPLIVVSTASPYKFPQDVLYALTGNDVKDSFKGVKRIHLLTAMKVPETLKALRYKPLRFKGAVSPDKIYEEVLKFIG